MLIPYFKPKKEERPWPGPCTEGMSMRRYYSKQGVVGVLDL